MRCNLETAILHCLYLSSHSRDCITCVLHNDMLCVGNRSRLRSLMLQREEAHLEIWRYLTFSGSLPMGFCNGKMVLWQDDTNVFIKAKIVAEKTMNECILISYVKDAPHLVWIYLKSVYLIRFFFTLRFFLEKLILQLRWMYLFK